MTEENPVERLQVEKSLNSFIVPVAKISDVLKLLQSENLLPQYSSFKNVVPAETNKRILLAEGVTKLPDRVKEIVGDVELEPYKVSLNYKNFKYTELLAYFLPEGMTIPTSFETIGHVAHLNLLPEQEPYKKIIGEAIMLKNKVIQTVACKVGKINNQFRNMNLEVIAGKDDFVTTVHQSGLTFKLDFSKVYWNSRLENEHNSVVSTFAEGSVVADAMCGIGPFAVRAALRKKCKVLANDLNPDSYKWLVENCKINDVEDNVTCFNMDAREFIIKVFAEGGCDYIVMNLPGTAVEFLDAVAEGATKYRTTARLPTVIFHSFDEKNVDHEQSLLARARKALGIDLPHLQVKNVRDVSPKKDMFRCTFNVSDLFFDDGP